MKRTTKKLTSAKIKERLIQEEKEFLKKYSKDTSFNINHILRYYNSLNLKSNEILEEIYKNRLEKKRVIKKTIIKEEAFLYTSNFIKKIDNLDYMTVTSISVNISQDYFYMSNKREKRRFLKSYLLRETTIDEDNLFKTFLYFLDDKRLIFNCSDCSDFKEVLRNELINKYLDYLIEVIKK